MNLRIAILIAVSGLALQGALANDSSSQTVPRWERLSSQKQNEAVAHLKKFAAQTQEEVKDSLVLFETQFFLFYTDLPMREARKWAGLLDRMYARLCKLFGVDKDSNIWWGKALVFVFTHDEDYRLFWRRMLSVDAGGSSGMCHSRSNGQVIIAFYRQRHEMDFATILVHESVHGFLHRYRSPVHVVSWANEGLADLIAAELVPKGRRVQRKQHRAKAILKKQGHMGGDFFDAQQIMAWQYGVASELTAFMLKRHKKGYVAFINGIKDGLSWRQSLKQHFGATTPQLTKAYGKSIGIRSLKP